MASNGYNGNGRPVVNIIQKEGRPWNDSSLTIETPDATYRHVTPGYVVQVLTSYPIKPGIRFRNHVSAGAKTFFRSAISSMPLPEALQEA